MFGRIGNKIKKIQTIFLLLLMAVVLQYTHAVNVYAATTLLNRSVRMASATAGVITDHQVRFTYTDFATAIGSVRIEFCSNDPIIETACVPPAGFDASGTALISQTGETGFSLHGSSDINNIVLTRPASVPVTGDSTYEFDNIQNPSNQGTFYVRLYTYTSTDGTGIAVQGGGIALSVQRQLQVASEVPPFLRFCVGVVLVGLDCTSASNFLIDLGEFSTSETKFAQAEMIAATNAPFGLNISINGTTLTSGNNIIDPLPIQTASSAGSSQFGINLRANSSPSIGADPTGPGTANPTAAYNTSNQFRFNPGDVVASSSGPNDYRKFTVSYIANIDAAQEPGIYATTISFICLANF